MPPYLGLLYPRVTPLLSVYVCVLLCYIALPTARSCAVWDDNNKDNVCGITISAGLKFPPPPKTIS